MNLSDTVAAQTSHPHTNRCWWDLEQAAWVCPDPTPAPSADRPLVDVRDMIVVHTALLRELRLAPADVERVPPGARRQTSAVDRHLGLLCDLLHHHHTSEDDLLWPPLRSRLPRAALGLLDEAEAQHAGIGRALDLVTETRRAWTRRRDVESRTQLVAALQTLHAALAEHLDTEERTLLPLAAAHLTEAEWRAIGEAGAAAIPKRVVLLVFGMFAYEGDPQVLADMLHAAPAPVRLLVPRLAPRVYARHAAIIHQTTRP